VIAVSKAFSFGQNMVGVMVRYSNFSILDVLEKVL